MNNPENARRNYGAEGLDKSVIDKRQILRIEQSLPEAWKNNLIIWSHFLSWRPVDTYTISYGTYFLFWDISFKVCNNACIMPSFGKNKFINFYSLFLKWIILLILKVTVLCNLSGYQTRIFH